MALEFLQGTRVLDLSQYIPGPYASLLLADLGADVIKIEPPSGDPMRYYGGGDGASAYYRALNGGKRVLTLDLKTPADKDVFRSLVGQADVLIESYRPGVLARLGWGKTELEAANPLLVHCAISNFGQTGPLALKAAHDLNCMALGGGLIASGSRQRPSITMPPVADYASALQASTTILAALAARVRNGGKGTFIDISMTDAVLAWQPFLLSEGLGRESGNPRGQYSDNGGSAPYNIYETSDGRFVSLAAEEEKFWVNFCRAVGREAWIARRTDPLPQLDLIAEIGAFFRSISLQECERLLDGVDCCYQAVLESREILEHPQLVSRSLMQRMESSGSGVEVLYPAWIDGAPPIPRPAFRDIGRNEASWR